MASRRSPDNLSDDNVTEARWRAAYFCRVRTLVAATETPPLFSK
jgi:hypothetical protein